MGRRALLLISAAALAPFAGCIVSDQLTTLTIQPDGSADFVRLQSNIHSSEPGEKGAEELRKFVADFDAHKDEDYQKILQAGGTVLESRWLRRQEPYANLVVARLPGASALVEFCTLKDEKGEVVARPRFTQAGKRRRLSVTVPLPKEKPAAEKPTVEKLRQDQANGIAETRIAVAGGQIVDSHGFTVATDRRSALLEPALLQEFLKAKLEKVEIYLEWELTGE